MHWSKGIRPKSLLCATYDVSEFESGFHRDLALFVAEKVGAEAHKGHGAVTNLCSVCESWHCVKQCNVS